MPLLGCGYVGRSPCSDRSALPGDHSGIRQPAISRQVAAMEAAAGYPLFARALGGVRITAAGAAVIERGGACSAPSTRSTAI